MKTPTLVAGLVGFIVSLVAVACIGPWYSLDIVRNLLAIVKILSLFASALGSLVASGKIKESGAQRSVWLGLGIGFSMMFLSQCVLFVEVTFLDMQGVFTTYADPLFLISYVFLIWALISFSLRSFGSGLPLGSPLAYLSPGLIVLILFCVGGVFLLYPVINSGAPNAEVFYNVFYPVADFILLVPCAVILRVSIKFRGGRLWMVWMPLTVGFVLYLLGDLVFAYQVSLNMPWLEPMMNFLFTSGYTVTAGGVLGQFDLIKTE